MILISHLSTSNLPAANTFREARDVGLPAEYNSLLARLGLAILV